MYVNSSILLFLYNADFQRTDQDYFYLDVNFKIYNST